MSVPHTTLICNQCNASASTLQLDKYRIYLDGGAEVPVRSTFGWCEECASIRPIERFDDAAQVRAELNDIETELNQRSSSWLKRLFNRDLPARSSSLIQLSTKHVTLQHRLALIEKRHGDEACLNCGSRRLLPFTGDYDLELGIDFFYKGSKPTGFFHPGCGGEFIAEGSDIRFHFARITYCYSPVGELLEERRT
uniref:hypothetical protein n=1 Tax=Marinobacterium profundum TaxID=1714300 RepID=UPI00082BA1E4|nr:hypothetical protein [Marinobacterium profundum]